MSDFSDYLDSIKREQDARRTNGERWVSEGYRELQIITGELISMKRTIGWICPTCSVVVHDPDLHTTGAVHR